MDVGFELMASDGWRNVTIDLLCRTAKLNKRYFYESFADLDELVAAVVEELAAAVIARGVGAAAEAAVRSYDTNALARHTLGAVVGYLLDDPRRAHVLFREVHQTPRAEAHRRATIRRLASVLSAYGHEHHKARGTDPIAGVASALLIGGSIEAILESIDGEIAMSRERLIDNLAALWIAVGDSAAVRAKTRAARRRS